MPTAAASVQETPIPIRMKRGREQSRASTSTSSATSAPPRMPASGRQTSPTAGKNRINASTTTLAPSLTPISPGSASPFRVMLCIAAPASPSIAPHSSAISSLGRRISNRIKRGWSPTFSGAKSARARVPAGSGKLPRVRPKLASSRMAIISTAAMFSAAGRRSRWQLPARRGRKPARRAAFFI